MPEIAGGRSCPLAGNKVDSVASAAVAKAAAELQGFLVINDTS